MKEQFLHWYLNSRTKIGRGIFNVLLIVATLPIMWLTLSDLNSALEGITQQVSSGNLNDLANMEQFSANAAQDLMQSMGVGGESQGLSFSDLLEVVIYIFFIPVVAMRFRDMGKWKNEELKKLIPLTYSSLIVNFSSSLFSIDFPSIITFLAGVASFVMFSWICIAKTAEPKKEN